MGSQSEKRSEVRHPCDATIEWAYFNKGDFFSARLFNFSRSGGCFVSQQGVIPGATVQIRLQKCISCGGEPADRNWVRTTGLGEVKWCRPSGDRTPHRFEIGIRYHLPV